jgi:hypothetical protein
MPRLAPFAPLAALVLLAVPLATRAEPPRAEGRIESDDSRSEILGKPVRVGERVDLPEGWFRVEEQGTEDEEVGSFTVVPAESLASVSPAGGVTEEEPSAYDPAVRPTERDCRAERAAYLSELWKTSGIEVARPDAVIDGLEGGRGAQLGFYWFALATDPFRPLAWSSALRSRADALARCVLGQ